MRELHVVALSEDGRHVVLATRKGAGRGEFRLAIDQRLAAAVRGDLPRPGEEVLPEVTPKDIQSRLRAGESVEQIAMSAGMPAARVERFAGPVFSERERVINGARVAIVNRTRRGPSGLPLGDAVDQHLAQSAGYRPESTAWSARREETGRWLVEVRWVSRAKARDAAWHYDPATKEVTPVDAASAALAHVDPPSGRREAEPVAAPRAVARSSRTAARPAAATTAKVAKAPATKKVAAAPRPAAPRPAAARTAAPRPAAAPAARPAAARSGAVRPAPPTRPASPAAAPAPRPAAAAAKVTRPAATKPRPTAAPAVEPVEVAPVEVVPVEAPVTVPNGPPTLRVVPPATEPEEPVAAEEPEPEAEPVEAPTRVRRTAGQRASVPSWSDVLLGTAPVDPPRGGRSD